MQMIALSVIELNKHYLKHTSVSSSSKQYFDPGSRCLKTNLLPLGQMQLFLFEKNKINVENFNQNILTVG